MPESSVKRENDATGTDIATHQTADSKEIGSAILVDDENNKLIGQKAKSGSLPVTLASDEDTVVVTHETPLGDSMVDEANDALQVNVVAGSGGGVSHTDDAAFTPGADEVVPAAGMFDDVAPDAVDEGDAGVIRMSSRREVYAQIRDAAGNERGLNVDAGGNIGVSDGGNVLTVDGTVNVEGGNATDVKVTLDSEPVALSGNLPDTGAGDLALQTADLDEIAGAVNAAKVDVNVASPVGQALMAASLPVTLASDQPDVKMTLDGEAVGLSGDLPDTAAGDLAAAAASLATIDDKGQATMLASLPVVVASDQSAIAVDATGQGDLPVTLGGELVDISDRAARDLGKIDVAGIDAIGTVAGQKTKLGSLPVTLASDEDTLTVDGTVTADAGTGPWPVTDNAGSLTVDQATPDNLNANANLQKGDVDVGATNPVDVIVRDGVGDSCMDDANNALKVNVVAGAGAGVSHVDDAAFTPGSDDVVPAAGVYQGTPDTVDDGDAGVVRMTQSRALVVSHETHGGDSMVDEVNDALQVNVVAGAAGGVSHVDDAAFTPGTDDIVPAGGVYQGTPDSVDDGDAGAMRMTQKRAQLTAMETPNGDSAMDEVNDALRVNVVAGSGAGVSHVDDAAFAVGTDEVVPAAGMFDDTAPDPVDEGDAGVVRMSARRELYTQIRDAAGNERGLNVDATGRIGVDATGAGDVPVTLDGELVDISDRAARDLGKLDVAGIDAIGGAAGQVAMASSLPVVVASDQSTLAVDVVDDAARDLGKVDVAGIDAIGTVAGQKTKAASLPVVLPSDQDAIPVTDDGGSLTVDGTVTADAGTGPWPVTDNAGSLTVDDGGTPLEVQGDVAENAPVGGNPVLAGGRYDSVPRTLGDGDVGAVALDANGAVQVSDGGSGLTVDGTVNVEGGNVADVKVTLDGELVDVSDRAARDLGKVDVAGIDTIGTAAGQAAMAASLPVVVASDQSAIAVDATGQGDVPVTLAGETVDISDRAARDLGTVDIAAELPAGTQNIGDVDIASGPVGASALEVQGTAADNAAVVGDPVLMGGYHNASVASGEEVGTGDAVRVLCDSKGGVVRGQPPDAWSANGNYAAAQTDASVKAAPGAGLSLYVTDIVFSTDAALNFFLESVTTTVVPAVYLAANGGWSGHFQTPIKWPANTAITITSSAAANHSILINGYTAP